MEALLVFAKWLAAVIVIPAVILGIIIGARWYKQPHRSIKISFLGFSVTLGEDK